MDWPSIFFDFIISPVSAVWTCLHPLWSYFDVIAVISWLCVC